MLPRGNMIRYGIVVCSFLFLVIGVFGAWADTTWQILSHIDDILKENPLAAGEKSQMIKLAEDDTISIFLIRMMPGAELGPHSHKTHDETEYVIRGSAQLLVNERWVEFKAGSFHFNPTNKVHASKNTGEEPLIVLIIFTPGMKETDRHFVK